MIDYVLNALLVAAVGLSLLKILDPARARARLFVCFGAIVLAALPWHWLRIGLPGIWNVDAAVYQPPATTVEVVMQPLLESTIPMSLGQEFTHWMFAVLLLAGVIAFVWVIHRQYSIVRSWRRIGRRSATLSKKVDSVPVWLVPGEKHAVATLFGVREIWIGESLADHPKLEVALTHELAHHRLNHPLYEWLLTFARCVLWWHPIIWFFVARARKEIEIECDEYCAKQYGPSSYQTDLAQLLVDIDSIPVGSAFGGRGSYNMERLRRLSRRTRVGWIRACAAALLFGVGGSGFVFVHAEVTPEIEQEHEGWNVRLVNSTLENALDHIAKMGGIDIYLDPRVETGALNFEASKIKSWEPLIEGVVGRYVDVAWAERGGVVIVGSSESLNDDAWLPDAIVLRGHGRGVFERQIEAPDKNSKTLYIDVKFEERFAQGNHGTSQMAILINVDKPASIRQNDIHITFDASSDTNQLSVGFFRILPDSRLSEVGRAIMSIENHETELFDWPDVNDVDYKLWLTLKEH